MNNINPAFRSIVKAFISAFVICSFALNANAGMYFVHSDQVGAPTKLSDSSKRVVWRAENRGYGENIVNDDVDGNGQKVTMPVRYPGQYFDAESGLHYNYFRYYDPKLGRYITSDPIGLAGGMNTYEYVGGNPVGFVDIYGLFQFGHRALEGFPEGPQTNGNAGLYHEHGFYQDGTNDNVGFFASDNGGRVGPDFGYPGNKDKYTLYPEVYDDALMRVAQLNVREGKYNFLKNNCQDYADELREEYNRLWYETFFSRYGSMIGVNRF